jgi:hypothetical protein
MRPFSFDDEDGKEETEVEGTSSRRNDDFSEEEEDFMSDSFLAGPSSSSAQVESYSEKRRREMNAAKDRGKTKSRIEREKEARKLGLSRNLMIKDSKEEHKKTTSEKRVREHGVDPSTDSAAPANKAMKMMLAMGYQHGEGLGKKGASSVKEQGEEIQTHTSLTEPLAIDERWLGGRARAGIGKMSASSVQALSRDILQASSKQNNEKDQMSAEEQFRLRSKQDHNVRHYESLLVNARVTCQDLDERLGVQVRVGMGRPCATYASLQTDIYYNQYSPLWINPESLSKHSDQVPEHVASLIQFAFAGLDEDKAEDQDAVARAKETKLFCSLVVSTSIFLFRRTHLTYCRRTGKDTTGNHTVTPSKSPSLLSLLRSSI